MNQIDRELEQVECRLSETWEALSVQRTINELADKHENAALNTEINEYAGFWRTVRVSLQTTIFTGIFSLLDERSSDSATFYSILETTSQTNTHPALNDMKRRLSEIRERYKKYRHKLFGHNDKKRHEWVNRFNAAGFTWVSMEGDLKYLDYVFKVIWQLNRNETPVDEATAQSLLFPHDQSRRAVIQQTKEFLQGLVARLPSDMNRVSGSDV